jgi:site-specific recombinase XerD
VEFASFLTAARRDNPTTYALMMLMGVSGLRVSEACGLNAASMKVEDGYETIRFIGKGNKAAIMRLEQPVARAVHEAVAGRDVGPLLMNEWQNRMTRGCAARLVSKTATAAGVRSDITPHSLRRTCATILLDLGVSLYEVQALLRHEDPKTTMRYDVKEGQRGAQAGGRIATYMATVAS